MDELPARGRMTRIVAAALSEAVQSESPFEGRKEQAMPAKQFSAEDESHLDAFIDPAAQLDKLAPDPIRKPRARSGGGATVASGPSMPADFFARYDGKAIDDQAIEEAAEALGCEAAAVKAVAEVESRGGGFDASQRPKILFERHVFARCTDPTGKFDGQFPDVSGWRKPYAPGTYGNGGKQYERLAQALTLDRAAALKAPSWGMFQILGENHRACGFETVEAYVAAMTVSEVEQLKAFVSFIRGDARLSVAIRKKDWPAFARNYNGAQFAKFQYDTKMAAAYRKHAAASA
ncbi:conserved hypothetical protein [Burkholderiales bacterium 8X]|nr:conserved hypothetical protein [Burkholderiales bacterium 8X]